MKIIDGHTHIGQWSSIFFNYKSSINDAIEVFKKSGVDEAICMPADSEPNERLLLGIKSIMDFKIYFCAWINPFDDMLDSFLEKNINDIKVFKVHPSLEKMRVSDLAYSKYLDIAEENNIPVIVHCGRWQEIAGYKFPLEIAEIRPNLNVILAHMGGDQPALFLSCAEEIKSKNFKNVYLGTESVREFYFVNKAVKIVSPERVIFGSDYNLGLPNMYIPIIDKLDIKPEEKELIFSENITRLMNS
jgi:predicted TIM-barrel fold metal-dependent hydrolase